MVLSKRSITRCLESAIIHGIIKKTHFAHFFNLVCKLEKGDPMSEAENLTKQYRPEHFQALPIVRIGPNQSVAFRGENRKSNTIILSAE
jgi:hypothetical protein